MDFLHAVNALKRYAAPTWNKHNDQQAEADWRFFCAHSTPAQRIAAFKAAGLLKVKK